MPNDSQMTPTPQVDSSASPTAMRRPADHSDAGNAAIFASTYRGNAVFVRSLGWLIWNGQHWKENDLKATALALSLSEKMLAEAVDALSAARAELTAAEGLQDAIRIEKARQAVQQAKAFLTHAHKTREAPRLFRMLELSKPALQVELDQLDSNPLLLNTPAGIVDLRTGMISSHDPNCLCANITETSPSNSGAQLWNDFLQTVTCGDRDLENFLQMVVGMAAVGKVYVESILIAYGTGANGKSTLFNVIAKVLGSYAGTMKSEVLTTSRRSKGSDLASLKGMRLVLAAELEENDCISTAMLKQLASTDKISGERKFRDPESFTPSHSIILFTNHLPKVGSNDNGTWRRITAVEFCAVIQPQTDVKNYGDILFEKAGGAILQWVIDGAVRFCNNGFQLSIPPSVQAKTGDYRSVNDTMRNFLEECCICAVGKSEKAGELYKAYREWAERSGEHVRRKSEFAAALQLNGFTSHRRSDGVYWHGLSLS